MTKEQLDQLETIYDLTSHAGWDLVVLECDEKVRNIKDNIVQPGELTGYELGVLHGKVMTYNEIVNMRRLVRLVLDQESKDDSGEADIL